MRILLAATAALLTLSPSLSAQLKVELEAGGGYTLVDVEAVADLDNEIATDWGQGMYRFAARVFFAETSAFEVGVEGGYQYLYWYDVRIPYGSTPIYRTYDVDAKTVAGVARFKGASVTLDVNGGVAFLGDPLLMTGASLGWSLTDKVAIRFRADALLGDEVTVPMGLHLSYSLGSFGG